MENGHPPSDPAYRAVGGIHNLTMLVPWQDSWAATFAAERQQIQKSLPAAVEIDHIGSTSVPGMLSKPILDILVCPAPDTPLDSCIPPLEAIGYTCLGECGRPGRFFFSKGSEEHHTFYLHLCYADHPVAQDQRLFQRLLRQVPDIFHGYVCIKTTLSELFTEDRTAYRIAKGAFIRSVLSAYRLSSYTRTQ